MKSTFELHGEAVDFETLLQWARNGNTQAAYLVSRCYNNGKGAEVNPFLELRWLITAANAGHMLAREILTAYTEEDGEKAYFAHVFHAMSPPLLIHSLPDDMKYFVCQMEAMKVLPPDAPPALTLNISCTLASSGYLEAIYARGEQAMQSGDREFGISELKKAAEKGYAGAKMALSSFYIKGEEVESDQILAERYVKEAADQGWLSALVAMGVLYERGSDEIVSDREKAIHYYTLAAESYHPIARHRLNILQGKTDPDGARETTPADLEELAKRARAGDVAAQSSLGFTLVFEDESEEYVEEGAHWLMQAAKQGHAPSISYLAFCFLTGKGVEQNIEMAITSFRAAAALGDETAKENLKMLEESGEFK